MLTIVLAEDDIDDQELLTEAFNEIDPSIRLYAFSTGKKFLSFLDELPDQQIPDLVILDYNIPELNGAEILRRLESNDRYRKIVKLVWSTSNSPLYQDSCLSLGARAYLVKPSNISALFEMARHMLTFLN